MSDAARPSPATAPVTTRRHFVRLGWIVAGLLAVGGQAWLLLKLFFTPTEPGEGRGLFTLGRLDAFPTDSAMHFRKARCILTRQATGLLALSDECTHQKCVVDYQPTRRVIVCPCHGSQFSLAGAVLTGPASRPLDRFVVTEQAGEVIVDTRQRLVAPAPG